MFSFSLYELQDENCFNLYVKSEIHILYLLNYSMNFQCSICRKFGVMGSLFISCCSLCDDELVDLNGNFGLFNVFGGGKGSVNNLWTFSEIYRKMHLPTDNH